MTNPWSNTNPHHQEDQIYYQSPSDGPYLAGQYQEPTQLDPNLINQGCSCSFCSAITRNITPAPGIGHQYPCFPGDPAIPYMYQNVGIDNIMDIAAMMDGQTHAVPVDFAPQADYAPSNHAAGPIQAQTGVVIDNDQTLDMSAIEGLRCLAGRYVNNPQSHVDAIRLEPSTSGRLRVTIMLEMVDGLRESYLPPMAVFRQ